MKKMTEANNLNDSLVNKLISEGKLFTREGNKVVKAIPVMNMSNERMYEIYVDGINWCYSTNNAKNGRNNEFCIDGCDLMIAY